MSTSVLMVVSTAPKPPAGGLCKASDSARKASDSAGPTRGRAEAAAPRYAFTASANCLVSVYCWNFTTLPALTPQTCANCARTSRPVSLRLPV